MMEQGLRGYFEPARCWPAREGRQRGRAGDAAAPGDAPGMLPVAPPLPAAFPGALEGTVGFGPPRARRRGGPEPPARHGGGSGGSGSGPGPVPPRAALGTAGSGRVPPHGTGPRPAAPSLPRGIHRPYRAPKYPSPALPLPSLPAPLNPRRADGFSAERSAMQTSAINAFETIYDFRPTSTCISIYLVSLICTLFFQNHKHSCWNFMWKCLRG